MPRRYIKFTLNDHIIRVRFHKILFIILYAIYFDVCVHFNVCIFLCMCIAFFIVCKCVFHITHKNEILFCIQTRTYRSSKIGLKRIREFMSKIFLKLLYIKIFEHKLMQYIT